MILNMRANLATLVDEFRRHSADTAVVAHRGNRAYRTTYGALATLAGRFSAELDRRGIAPGERVVLWGANSAEWIAAFFGCILRGLIVVPLDASGTAEFAGRVVRDTRPKLIVGDGHLLAALSTEALQTEPPQLEFGNLVATLPAEALFTVSEAIEAHTPFQIVFTSGTTAEPRGIVHTHRNILVSIGPIEREMQKYLRYERVFHPLRFLHMLPLSHVFGQFMGLWCPALLGAEVHFAEEVEPSRIVSLIKRERISVLIAVPRMLALLRTHLLARFPELAAQIDLADGMKMRTKWWRFRRVHGALGWKFWAVISGGATLPAELESFWNRLGFALIQGYGMTETAALVTLNHPFHIKQGSIGRPLPGREVRISADGEVLVRGGMLADATWQGGEMRQREGEWLATGDLAETTASGDLRFLGRKGDVIVTSAGLNIHPADLEAALLAQQGIRAAMVVACDLRAGPEPVAVVITALGEAELQCAVDAANRTLAEFQQIRRVLRWPGLDFPMTSTGKLIRREVAGWACGQLAGRGVAADVQDSLLAVISEVTGEAIPAGSEDGPQGLKPGSNGAPYGTAEAVPLSKTVELKDSTDTVPSSGTTDAAVLTGTIDSLRLSEDLHLDSLGRVQLQSALEQRFSIEVDDDAIAGARTVGDLRALVEFAGQSQGGRSSVSRLAVGTNVESSESSNLSVAVAGGSPASNRDDIQQPTADHIYPRWPWSAPVQMLRTVWIECVMRPLVWLLAAPRVTYSGAGGGDKDEKQIPFGNDKPRVGSGGEPVLIICNHVTSYDGAFVLYALPPRLRRRVAAAMSGEMLMDYRLRRNQGNAMLNAVAPAAYWLLTALFNVFPLPRARGFRRSFAHAGEAMDRGYSVLIFPEGTRSLTGHINPFRPGIGLLAQQSQVPILPVALVGLYDRPANRGWFHSGEIEIRVGEIIAAPSADAEPGAVATQLERALHDLLSPASEKG